MVVDREWKIRADRKLEKVILQVLTEGSDYPILSEESGVLAGDGERQWLVDPLDGSVNFSRELPFSAISVGLWENGHPSLGVVLEIPARRLFSGIVDKGAWCDDIPIWRSASSCPIPSEAILCTGLPVGLNHTVEQFQVLFSAYQLFGKTRMLGSAALMLCYVASGKCDSYWERRIALWDVGAALAIVKAAGGAIRVGEVAGDYRLDVEAAGCESLLVSEVYGE
jgi:myo-inositol-1(or 4)-monophosphatase